MGESNNAIDFGVIKGTESNAKYYKNKKIITFCGHDGKPIREGETYLVTPDGVHLRDKLQTLIDYYNLHRIYDYDGGNND